MKLSDVAAVVITTGTRDVSWVVNSLSGFGSLTVWDNSKCLDFKVFSRWLAASQAKLPYCYVQDDDTVVDVPALFNEWDRRCSFAGSRIVCNMPMKWRPHYTPLGISLVGFGCFFPQHLAMAGFDAYAQSKHPIDDVFLRECDRVWTHSLRDRIDWADAKIHQMDYSSAPDRMYVQPCVRDDYREIRRRLGMRVE